MPLFCFPRWSQVREKSVVMTLDGTLQRFTGSVVFTTNTLAIESGTGANTVINSLAITNQVVDLPDTSGVVDVTPS